MKVKPKFNRDVQKSEAIKNPPIKIGLMGGFLTCIHPCILCRKNSFFFFFTSIYKISSIQRNSHTFIKYSSKFHSGLKPAPFNKSAFSAMYLLVYFLNSSTDSTTGSIPNCSKAPDLVNWRTASLAALFKN